MPRDTDRIGLVEGLDNLLTGAELKVVLGAINTQLLRFLTTSAVGMNLLTARTKLQRRWEEGAGYDGTASN